MQISPFGLHFPASNKDSKYVIPALGGCRFTVQRLITTLPSSTDQINTATSLHVLFASQREQLSNCCFTALFLIASRLHYP